MEKKKVGRPRKISKDAVVLDVKKNVATNKYSEFIDWERKYNFVAQELETAKAMILEVNRTSNEIIEKQADRQLDIVKLTLDSYNTIEKHCERVTKLTGNIDESDVLYLTSVARRALLHKFVEFNEDLED
jgi:hypothetical protein